jgi:hypothetical protein
VLRLVCSGAFQGYSHYHLDRLRLISGTCFAFKGLKYSTLLDLLTKTPLPAAFFL